MIGMRLLEDTKERIAKENANIQRVDAQVKGLNGRTLFRNTVRT